MDVLGLGEITALLTAIGVLSGTVASAAIKIGNCLSDLRRQTARVQSTATQTKNEVTNETALIRSKIETLETGMDRLRDAVFDRANVTDARINQMAGRIESVEVKRT